MIGFFDSGSGGLTILNAVRKAMPDAPLIYLGDHARAPYGHRSSEDIIDFTKEGVSYLYREGADVVVLACNTAAAIALRSLQQNWLPSAWPQKRLLGVLVPMVEGVTGVSWRETRPVQSFNKKGHVTLFATRRTILSGAYREEVLKRAPNIRLSDMACPGLVDAIEGGAPDAALEGLIKGFIDTALGHYGTPHQVILGCTHFPLVRHYFKAHLPASVDLYDQPALVAAALKDYVARHNLSFAPKQIGLFSTAKEPPGQTLFQDLPDFKTAAP